MKLGVIGTGLIGASIGLRARAGGSQVVGCDVNADATRAARDRGAIDAVAGRAEIFASCDTIVLATPLKETIAQLRSPDARSTNAHLLLDVASVKAPIVAAAVGVRNFVATHPLAGGERSGPSAASPAMFEDRPWAYVPSGDAASDRRAVAFIASMGAHAFAVDAADHDRRAARTSHVLQLLAWLVTEHFDEGDAALCGPVARELQRIARSDRALWDEIFAANAGNVAREARMLARALDETARRLDDTNE